MKTFTLKFDCDNAAFEGDPTPEIVRILRLTAQRIEMKGAPTHFQTILDINGNDVGRYALKEERS